MIKRAASCLNASSSSAEIPSRRDGDLSIVSLAKIHCASLSAAEDDDDDRPPLAVATLVVALLLFLLLLLEELVEEDEPLLVFIEVVGCWGSVFVFRFFLSFE